MTDAPRHDGRPQDPTGSPTVDVSTVAAMSLVVYALGLALHEWSHAAAAWTVGGVPALVSSTDMRGDMSALTPGGTVWTAGAGSLANCVLAGLGLGVARLSATPPRRAFGWLLAAVNGLIPSVYLVVSPLLGFGDWMTAIGRFDHQALLRFGVTAIGVMVVIAWIRLVSRGLADLLLVLAPRDRAVASATLTRTAWLAGGALGLAASLLSPLGLGWAVSIGVGSTLGTTWPLLLVGERAREEAASGPAVEAAVPGPLVGRSRFWIGAGLAAALSFCWFLGRGISI